MSITESIGGGSFKGANIRSSAEGDRDNWREIFLLLLSFMREEESLLSCLSNFAGGNYLTYQGTHAQFN